jgi:hypothetical protein
MNINLGREETIQAEEAPIMAPFITQGLPFLKILTDN